MSGFYELLKCLLCCEDDHYEREERIPFNLTFGISSLAARYRPVRQSDPERAYSPHSTDSTRIRSLQNSPHDGYVPPRIPSIPPRVPVAPPRVPVAPPRVPVAPPRVPVAPPRVPVASPRVPVAPPRDPVAPPRVPVAAPRVPVAPPRLPVVQPAVIDFARAFDAESVSLSSSASYPPPSSSSQSFHYTAESPPYLSTAASSEKTPSNSKSFQSSGPSSSSVHKSDLPSFKPTLVSSPSISRTRQGRTNYTWVERGASPIFVIPKDIEEMIKKDIVPKVLNRPLSPSTYTDYFAALLYAEDYYTEKWSNYLLKNVTLELHEASIYRRGKSIFENESDDKTFVAFEMDSVPERRPFLLSRDFVFLQPTGSTADSFQGVIYRVVKSKTVLVEFDEDFYAKHHRSFQYNISFSFNRFCLKRAHQAIKAASDPLFRTVVFPDFVHRSLSSPSSCSFTNTLDFKQKIAVSRILGLSRIPPFLVEGPLSVHKGKLSKTGLVIREAIVHILHATPNSRILVCAPTNSTCDVLMKNLKNGVSASDMFRANAAFRELDGVPVELLPSCRYKDECFTCPSLDTLKNFKVVLSTFVSSFRLHGEGITAGHFTHIFLVDGSSVTEPELMVALANFANEDTSVVVTGEPKNRSSWVRSNIARQNGLRISYFERLRERKPYKDLDPMFIVQLENTLASDNS